MSLDMVVTQGLFLIGEIQDKNVIKNPRVLTILEEGKKIQMTPLPGLPARAQFPDTALRYKIPMREDGIYNLYAQVTAPGVDPNVDPGRRGAPLQGVN